MHPAALAAFSDELEKIGFKNVAAKLARPKMPSVPKLSFGGSTGAKVQVSKPKTGTASMAFRVGNMSKVPKALGMPNMPKPPMPPAPKI